VKLRRKNRHNRDNRLVDVIGSFSLSLLSLLFCHSVDNDIVSSWMRASAGQRLESATDPPHRFLTIDAADLDAKNDPTQALIICPKST
jgi:hypothetical protein